MTEPPKTEPSAARRGVEPWFELRVKVPSSWKRWLDEAASARAMSVSDLVRQCIRALMIQRHDADNGPTP